MYGDKIKCLNCGKVFKDTTRLSIQNSREGKFKNLCPHCYCNKTVNLVKCKKVAIPKKERERREKNRCEVCSADISSRGNRATKCKKCQKVKRADDNADSKRKERLLKELAPEVKAFIDECFKLTEDELIDVQAESREDYKRLAVLVQQKKFHPKPSKYDLERYSTEEFEHEILGIFKNREYSIEKNESLEDKSWMNTGCISEKPKEDSLDVRLEKSKGGWVNFYNTDEIVTTNPDLFFAKPQEEIVTQKRNGDFPEYRQWRKNNRRKRQKS